MQRNWHARMRVRAVIVATAAVAGLVPATASARTIEIGNSATEQGRPTCPGTPCLAITRTTGYQDQAAGRNNPYLVTQAGSLVALTVALGKPSTTQQTYFEKNFGQPSVRLTVLTPRRRRNNQFYFRVKAQSETFQLKKYLGMTAQFAFKNSIAVTRGDLVGVTSASWAPMLASGLSNLTTWRAARGKPCSDTFKQTARQTVGQLAQYYCQYKTARLTYSVLEIVTP